MAEIYIGNVNLENSIQDVELHARSIGIGGNIHVESW